MDQTRESLSCLNSANSYWPITAQQPRLQPFPGPHPHPQGQPHTTGGSEAGPWVNTASRLPQRDRVAKGLSVTPALTGWHRLS